jgi:hypothetical protein
VYTRPPIANLIIEAAIAATIPLLLIGAMISTASAGGAGGLSTVYLSQAAPLIADAQANLDSLKYYLPLGSEKDANDPTWSTAELSAEALQGDADALKLLDPPDDLTTTNAALVASLTQAGTSAETAIEALSSGNSMDGSAALATFTNAVQTFTDLAAGLPLDP